MHSEQTVRGISLGGVPHKRAVASRCTFSYHMDSKGPETPVHTLQGRGGRSKPSCKPPRVAGGPEALSAQGPILNPRSGSSRDLEGPLLRTKLKTCSPTSSGGSLGGGGRALRRNSQHQTALRTTPPTLPATSGSPGGGWGMTLVHMPNHTVLHLKPLEGPHGPLGRTRSAPCIHTLVPPSTGPHLYPSPQVSTNTKPPTLTKNLLSIPLVPRSACLTL